MEDKKISYSDFIAKLDNAQRAAAVIETNAVIAAGAGSGKTKVLSARYIHLITAKGYKTDEILTLTFTQKAATEMRSRIYQDLCKIDHPNAVEAVRDFHKAQISTIDSFCTGIAKHGCRRFGISPDYTLDDEGALHLARQLALPFVLEHRNHAAIKSFLKRFLLIDVANSFLAETIHNAAAISAPLDVVTDAKKQGIYAAEKWNRFAEETETFMDFLAELSGKQSATLQKIKDGAKKLQYIPRLQFDPEKDTYGSFCGFTKTELLQTSEDLAAFKTNTKSYAMISAIKDDDDLKEQFKNFRDITVELMQSIIQYVCSRPVTEDALSLLDEFQRLYLNAKRTSKIATFRDIARLAVDALKADPELRQSYKTKLNAIMIDEFQDDNELQRDLLFLLAEKEDLHDVIPPEVSPGRTRICENKLFFVGDEKQSIYRFRGADVAVFRRLTKDLGCVTDENKMPELTVNYRTQKKLIKSFNKLFPNVFLPAEDLPDYEASFTPITPFRDAEEVSAGIELFIVNKDYTGKNFPGVPGKEEAEAITVAKRIHEMVSKGVKIYDRDAECVRPLKYEDIAILFKTKTHQHHIERYLRHYNIPYAAENQRGLFSDAPVNDMYSIMRLAVYPRDRLAYAALLRSPFARLSDNAVAAVLAVTDPGTNKAALPFCPEAEAVLDENELPRFARARTLYETVASMIDRKPISEIITWLWYTSGYRYEIISKPRFRIYADLYDFFFELARLNDQRGISAAQFLDNIAEMMEEPASIDDISIPVERQAGVTLMTVHKSKGLEFPVVFAVNCGNGSTNERNTEPVYLSKEFGITVDTSGSPETGSIKADNFFYIQGKNENKWKAEAELRRLLYVAMTRAENTLVISGAKNLGSAEDKNGVPVPRKDFFDTLPLSPVNKTPEEVRNHPSTFFDALLFACVKEPGGIKLQEVLPQFCGDILQNAPKGRHRLYPPEAVSRIYEDTPEAVYTQKNSDIVGASQLHLLDGTNNSGTTATDEKSGEEDQIDALLKGTELNAAHFGTIVHSIIEARIHGEPFAMPRAIQAKIDISTAKKLTEAATVFAERFFNSPLAALLDGATFVRSEYSLQTKYVYNGQTLIVHGQIDLLFQTRDNAVYVVDFKTDRTENPDIHVPQLSAYKKAVGDLFAGQTVKGMLFYLRTGNTVEV